jgi:SPP1 family phage portal protein
MADYYSNLTKPKYFTTDKEYVDYELAMEAIKWNSIDNSRRTKLKNYYLGKHDIAERYKVTSLKNNKLIINHARYITDVNVGYLIGKPVGYEHVNDVALDAITNRYKATTINETDVDIAEDVSIYGKAYEYVYTDESGHPASAIIDPTCAVIIYDSSIERRPIGGIIYSHKTMHDKQATKVTIINKDIIREYDEGGILIDEAENLFQDVSLIRYTNNRHVQGDFEQVIGLIDAYNILQSDRINDKEQLVDAILVMHGVMLEDDQKADLMRHRVLSVPVDSKVEYLIKTFDESQVDILRQRIEDDIHKISMTPNLTDENFAGNASGVAIRYKLITFEQNIARKESQLVRSLKQRFNLYNKIYTTRSEMPQIELHELKVNFHRNLPQNDYEASQMINNLRGVVDKETLINTLSFIQDADQVLEKAREENLASAFVDLPAFGAPVLTDEQ